MDKKDKLDELALDDICKQLDKLVGEIRNYYQRCNDIARDGSLERSLCVSSEALPPWERDITRSPEALEAQYREREIENRKNELIQVLLRLDTYLKDFQENRSIISQAHEMHNQIHELEGEIRSSVNFDRKRDKILRDATREYELSGSSGNPPNSGGIRVWENAYRNHYSEYMDELHKWEMILQEIIAAGHRLFVLIKEDETLRGLS